MLNTYTNLSIYILLEICICLSNTGSVRNFFVQLHEIIITICSCTNTFSNNTGGWCTYISYGVRKDVPEEFVEYYYYRHGMGVS